MASGKKPCARRDALRSCPQSGHRAAAARCPRALKPRALKSAALHAEFPHPYCASGPADRGVDQGTRFYRSRPVRWGNTIFAGTGICSGPGRGNCATPGFIRTDVGMPVADHRIDMCRTGPPCKRHLRGHRKEGKAGNDTSNSPALPAVLTGAPSPAFPVVKTGAAVRFSLRFYAGMVRREANGARCEPAVGDVRSAQVTGARQEIAGLHTATDTATDRFLYPGNFPPVFSLNFRRNPGETG